YTNHSRMNRLLFSLIRRFSSTCSQVRDVARLLRLVVYARSADGFCHMPKVWLKNPETWKPLSHGLSGAAPPAPSGSTDVVAPVTFKPSGCADKSAAIDFPAQSPTIASATASAAIFLLTLPDEHPTCTSVSIQIPP